MRNQHALERLQLFSDFYLAERAILKEMPLFADFYEAEIDAFIYGAERHSVPAGHIFLEEGAANDRIYLICHGSISVLSQKSGAVLPGGTRGVGETFGALSFMDDCPAKVSVRAAEATTVLELNRDAIHWIIADNTALSVKFLAEPGDDYARTPGVCGR